MLVSNTTPLFLLVLMLVIQASTAQKCEYNMTKPGEVIDIEQSKGLDGFMHIGTLHVAGKTLLEQLDACVDMCCHAGAGCNVVALNEALFNVTGDNCHLYKCDPPESCYWTEMEGYRSVLLYKPLSTTTTPKTTTKTTTTTHNSTPSSTASKRESPVNTTEGLISDSDSDIGTGSGSEENKTFDASYSGGNESLIVTPPSQNNSTSGSDIQSGEDSTLLENTTTGETTTFVDGKTVTDNSTMVNNTVVAENKTVVTASGIATDSENATAETTAAEPKANSTATISMMKASIKLPERTTTTAMATTTATKTTTDTITTTTSMRKPDTISPTKKHENTQEDPLAGSTIATTTLELLSNIDDFDGFENNNSSMTNGSLRAKSADMSTATFTTLIVALSVGAVMVGIIVTLGGKRVYDNWNRRQYQQIDYLVDGM